MAFWINVYNTCIQYTLGKDPSLFEDRGAFFKAKQLKIAGIDMSFDIIEHGILRRSKNKLSGGYLGKLRVPKYERKLRIRKVDGRIHYALNCGAKSCPPIFAYHADKVNQELDASVKKYLQKHVVVEDKVVKAPVLFSWFRGDFGGKKGIMKFMIKYDVIAKEDRKKELKFLEYDWTLALDPYAE